MDPLEPFLNFLSGGMYSAVKGTAQAAQQAGMPSISLPSISLPQIPGLGSGKLPGIPGLGGQLSGIGAPQMPSGGEAAGVTVGPPPAMSGAGSGSGTISGNVSGTISGTLAGTVPVQGVGTGKKCCCYTISDDYLLNGDTGDVWLINREKMELHPFHKVKDPLQASADALGDELVRQSILERKESILAALPQVVRASSEKHIEGIIGALGNRTNIPKKKPAK